MTNSMIICGMVYLVVEAVKQTKKIATAWLPMIAIVLGGCIGVIFAIIEPSQSLEHVVIGLFAGGASAGLYDAIKSGIALIKNG